ncbi:hypothetical protein OROGR_010517 [Orobanche gracilis]
MAMKEAAKMVVKKHYLKLRDRELRLSRSVSTSPPLKRKLSTSQQHTSDNSYSSKKTAFAPSRTRDSGDNNFKGTANLSYQGLRASKTGSHKKVHTKVVFPAKSKHQPAIEQKSRSKKRPAVAARKQKVLKAANASQLAGTKRKISNRTPSSPGQKKKAKKLR